MRKLFTYPHRRRTARLLPLFAAVWLLAACSPAKPVVSTEAEEPDIVDMLLPDELSEERTEPVTHIVIHFMSNVMAKPDDPFEIDDAYAVLRDAGVSAHFVVARDGTVYRFVPTSRVAWHAGKGSWNGDSAYENRMNLYSIGIELLGIGTREEMSQYLTDAQYDALDSSGIGFTGAQYRSLSWLLLRLNDEYPGVPLDRDHVIGHSEYASRKPDPGALFDWSRLPLRADGSAAESRVTAG